MQTQVDTAIYNHINSSSALASLLGGSRFFADAAPQDSEFPFLIWLHIIIDHQETFNTILEESSIQFSIFSKNQSAAEVNEIADILFQLFDNAVVDIDDYHSIRFRRVSARRIKDPEDAWHYMAEYAWLIQLKEISGLPFFEDFEGSSWSGGWAGTDVIFLEDFESW